MTNQPRNSETPVPEAFQGIRIGQEKSASLPVVAPASVLPGVVPHALAACVEGHRAADLESTGTIDPRLDLARARLIEPSGLIPGVRELARLVGLSESKLKRDFKAAFGKSIVEYALERRMALAMDMLRAGTKPVGEVAAAVGYRHHTSFTAAFRRFYGFSPRTSGKATAH